MSNKGYTLSLAVVFAVLALFPGTASASFVSGQLNISSAGTPPANGVTVTLNGITWVPPAGVSSGLFLIGGGSVSFASYVGANGAILDLTSAAEPVDNIALDTLNGVGFMTLPLGATTIQFNLTRLVAGVDFPNTPSCLSASNLTTCALPGSPFQLQSDPTFGGVDVQMDVFANAFFTATPTQTTSYLGTFSTAIPNTTIAQLTALLQGGGSVTNTFQGTFTPSPVPEPGTLQLGLGAALLLAGGLARRRG